VKAKVGVSFGSGNKTMTTTSKHPAKKPKPSPPTPSRELYGLPFTADEFKGMPYRLFGNTGLRVSPLGLGTWKFGYPQTGDGSRVDEKTAFRIFDKAVEEGVTFWDTANRYNASSGNSERVIGRWFAANPDQRRNVELATKLYGLMDGKTPNFCRLSRVNVMEAVYASLDRLRTDRVEILQFHAFDETTPVEESLAAVEDLIAQDLVRYFGLSNVDLDQLGRYVALSEIFRRARVRSVQNQFDILHGEDPKRKGVLDYCAANGLSFIPWSPLRSGLLTERYLEPSKAKAGDRLVDEKRLDREAAGPVLKKLATLAALAREGSMSLAQLVLTFMRGLPGIGPIIVGCSTPGQLVENARAGKIRLGEEQLRAVRRIVSA
jgi:aryl-alcohol dehydrogenase-like predicted oxidoreductase